ncbi:MAG: hypothetical protein HDQ93_03435 [Desulfovibrio sp.]|nr:hypothetical protein [Desulfovibrio sp.]
MNDNSAMEAQEESKLVGESCIKLARPLNRILEGYEKQVLTARQLARFRAKSRKAAGLDPAEPERGQNRERTISSVVEELSLTLMFTGNKFPIIEDIRKEVSRQLDKEVEFVYPPGKPLKYYIRDEKGLRRLTPEEQRFLDEALIRITRQKVDEKMADHPRRIDRSA